ncbi:FAD-dependent oxidoreductase [Paenarthrobacter nitroguajacolicus]
MFGVVTQTAGFGHSPVGFHTGLNDRFLGGAGVLLEKTLDSSDVEVRFDHLVTQVGQNDHGVTVQTQSGEVIHAKTCVMAIPTNVLHQVESSPQLGQRTAELLRRDALVAAGCELSATITGCTVARTPLNTGKESAAWPRIRANCWRRLTFRMLCWLGTKWESP